MSWHLEKTWSFSLKIKDIKSSRKSNSIKNKRSHTKLREFLFLLQPVLCGRTFRSSGRKSPSRSWPCCPPWTTARWGRWSVWPWARRSTTRQSCPPSALWRRRGDGISCGPTSPKCPWCGPGTSWPACQSRTAGGPAPGAGRGPCPAFPRPSSCSWCTAYLKKRKQDLYK